jgi:hypothetical protein
MSPDRVSVCSLDLSSVRYLTDASVPDDLLRSAFRVTVALESSAGNDGVPALSGRYQIFNDHVQFIPHFPLEIGLKYGVNFDLSLLGASPSTEPLIFEFEIPPEQTEAAPNEVTDIFPSSGLLPENLLRFYVCFSNPMQRGRVLEEITLFDSEGKPVPDALYRAPVELWNRTMRRLTVLLDPGRLKRFVGPNVELGPPLSAGKMYTLEIGVGLTDVNGRPLQEPFRKHFIAADPVRESISLEHWGLAPPVAASQQPLVLIFPNPLDWALLFHAITIQSADGSVIKGRITVDQSEKRWNFTPTSSWTRGTYRICVKSNLEDVCGNTITGAFEKPIRKDFDQDAVRGVSFLTFRPI